MTDTHSSDSPNRIQLVVSVLLVGMAVAGILDMIADGPEIWRGLHGVVELAFTLLALSAAVLLGRGWLRAERSAQGLRESLARHASESSAWRSRAEAALRGLGEAMDTQFERWALTPAEKQTAMFLLKGYSHKETAGHLRRSERTVRQHAVSVYRKSGLSGRAELAAFFFEDLLLPGEDR